MSKLTKSARGRPCTVRIPGVCRMAPENETTVLAHLNGAGMALKHDDQLAAFACFECHMVLDGHAKSRFTREDLDAMHWKGIKRTRRIWKAEGLI